MWSFVREDLDISALLRTALMLAACGGGNNNNDSINGNWTAADELRQPTARQSSTSATTLTQVSGGNLALPT
jgi:hypothetical protein